VYGVGALMPRDNKSLPFWKRSCVARGSPFGAPQTWNRVVLTRCTGAGECDCVAGRQAGGASPNSSPTSRTGFEHGRYGRLYSFSDCGWLSDPSRVIREGSVVSVPLLGVPCVS